MVANGNGIGLDTHYSRSSALGVTALVPGRAETLLSVILPKFYDPCKLAARCVPDPIRSGYRKSAICIEWCISVNVGTDLNSQVSERLQT